MVLMLLVGCAGLVFLLVAAVGVMLAVKGRLSRDEFAQLSTLSTKFESLQEAVDSYRRRDARLGRTKPKEEQPSLPDGTPAELTRPQRRAAIMARLRTGGSNGG